MGPAFGIVHCAVKNPFPERRKQAGVLGDRNEVCGRHITMQRMLPAQQGFHPMMAPVLQEMIG
jgi:hypothetical protein